MSGEEATYFIKHKGKTQGPLTSDAIQLAIKRGRVTRAHFVSRDGVSWAPAVDFAELFGAPPVPASAASQSPSAGVELEAQAPQPHSDAIGSICWSCPRCRTVLTVADEDAGATAECPSCGATSVAPDGRTPPSPKLNPNAPWDWEHIAQHLRFTRPWVRCLSIVGFVEAGLIGIAGAVASAGAFTRPDTFWFGTLLLVCSLGAAVVWLLPSLNLYSYANRISEFLATPNARRLEAVLQAQGAFWRLVGILTLTLIALGLFASVAAVAKTLEWV